MKIPYKNDDAREDFLTNMLFKTYNKFLKEEIIIICIQKHEMIQVLLLRFEIKYVRGLK